MDPPGNYYLYDDNGEKINFSYNLDKWLDSAYNNHRTMDKIMENVMVKDFQYKDLFPPGNRLNVLYLGDQNFDETYRMWIKAKRDVYEAEKARKKANQSAAGGEEGKQGEKNVVEEDDDDDFIPVDKEQ